MENWCLKFNSTIPTDEEREEVVKGEMEKYTEITSDNDINNMESSEICSLLLWS